MFVAVCCVHLSSSVVAGLQQLQLDKGLALVDIVQQLHLYAQFFGSYLTLLLQLHGCMHIKT